MFKQKRLTVLTLAVLLALMFAATMPLAVFAQDETPPATEVSTVVDEPVADQPVAEVPAAVDVPAVDQPAGALTVPEILDQLPAETDLVVMDQTGETLPLASLEAAEVLAAPDPQFCPEVGACADSRTTIWEAIADAYAAGGNGTIYVEAGTFKENVVIDGSLFKDGIVPTNFTIWGAGSDSTTINGTFTATNMNAFTLNGFSIMDTVNIQTQGDVVVYDVLVDGTKSAGGLNVISNGNVGLNYVTSNESDEDGATVYAQGDVTVENSVFSNNTYSGLVIGSESPVAGNVVLTNVQSTWNGDGNVETLDDFGADVFTSGDITVNGGNFSHNQSDGLTLVGANVTLNNVIASDNYYEVSCECGYSGGSGVSMYAGSSPFLEKTSVSESSVATGGNVTVNGGNFNNNYLQGISIYGANNVTLNNVTANGNGNAGAGVFAFNDVNILVNGGNFDNNGGLGLLVYGLGGNVTLKNVNATGNGITGAGVLSGGDVNVICGNYSNNGDYGLEIDGANNISLNGPIYEGNGLGGYQINSEGTLSFGGCPEPADKPAEIGGGKGFKKENKLFPQIPVTGEICSGEKKIVLKVGDAIGEYENLCDIEFQLNEVDPPGTLPSGIKKLASLETRVISGGNNLAELPSGGKITLKFSIPDGTDNTTLAAFFWDGAKWVEVSGEVIDGFYVINAASPGIYMLATR